MRHSLQTREQAIKRVIVVRFSRGASFDSIINWIHSLTDPYLLKSSYFKSLLQCRSINQLKIATSIPIFLFKQESKSNNIGVVKFFDKLNVVKYFNKLNFVKTIKRLFFFMN